MIPQFWRGSPRQKRRRYTGNSLALCQSVLRQGLQDTPPRLSLPRHAGTGQLSQGEMDGSTAQGTADVSAGSDSHRASAHLHNQMLLPNLGSKATRVTFS